jgi:hypothetical protein
LFNEATKAPYELALLRVSWHTSNPTTINPYNKHSIHEDSTFLGYDAVLGGNVTDVSVLLALSSGKKSSKNRWTASDLNMEPVFPSETSIIYQSA